MRRNIFTSYIIRNCLNLKTFFEPIIDFIEIGKPRYSPSENRIWEFHLVQLKQKTKIEVLSDMCSKLTNCMMHSFLKIGKNKNPKALYCGYNAKISSRLIIYMSIRPLESSILPIFFYCFVICVEWDFTTVLFIIDRDSLVKTLWIN